ncbi:unnamed protein product [[Candida] boidinii]|nr:unnamed protein product [[Candida] boidinii]
MSDSFVFANTSHSSTNSNGSGILNGSMLSRSKSNGSTLSRSKSKSKSSKKPQIALSELLSSENEILSLNDTMAQTDTNDPNIKRETDIINTVIKPYVILGLNEQAPFILSDTTTNKITVNDISTPTASSKTFDFDYIFQDINASSSFKNFRLQEQKQRPTNNNNNPIAFLTPTYHDNLINDILNGYNVTIVMYSMNDNKDSEFGDEENNIDDHQSFKSSRSSKSSKSSLLQANYNPITDTQQDGETPPKNKDIYTLIANLFKEIQSCSNKFEHTIKCCCLEFTNDGEIYDLINSNTENTYNNSDNNNNNFENLISFDESLNELKGQKYVYLSNYSDFADVLSISNLNRKNQYNSNIVSTIKLSRSEFGEGLIKNSTINLIDLSNHDNSLENLNLLNSLLIENNSISSSHSNTFSKLFNSNAKLTFFMDLLNLSNLETSFNVINTCSKIRENLSNTNNKNIKQNIEFTYDLLKRKFVELQNENREYKSKVNLLENEKLNFKFNNSEINSRTLNTFKLKNKALKDEIFGLKNLLEFYKLSNDDDSTNNNNKNSTTSKDQTLNILNESFNDLTLNQTKLMDEMEFHCNKVNELTNKLNNYNEKLNYYNNNDKKIESLEKSLNQFTLHIDQIEIQNQNLKIEINSINKLCDLKQEKIKYLESKLIDQNKNVSHDSSFFEDRLSFLKTRLISSKSALSTSSTTSNNNNNNNNNNGSILNHQNMTSTGSSSSYSNSNSLNYLDYSSTSLPDLPTSPNTTASSYSELMNDNNLNDNLKPNIKIRSGFNLRIVKPSGENESNES